MSKKSQMDQNQQQQLPINQVEEDEIEEIEPAPQVTVYDKIVEMTEKFAGTRIGQFVIERGDRALKTIEHTAKWSLPQEYRLERPLPWIPFIMMIIVLRLARIWLSVAAVMIGNEPVSPKDMIYFIQTRRRKLRAIRVHGLKEIQRRQEQANAMSSGDSAVTFVGKMKKLLSMAICRPGQQSESAHCLFMQSGRVQQNIDKFSADRQTSKRPREDDSMEQNLTCDELLSKYANEDSDDDSDFIPNPDEVANDDSTSSGTDNSLDEAEGQSKDTANEEAARNDESNNQDVESVIVVDTNVATKENGGRKSKNIPKPIAAIKKEKLSDIESGNEQTPKENGPYKSDENREVDFAHERNSTPTTDSINTFSNFAIIDDSTMHETAASLMKSRIAPTFGTTATARSPPDFNACFKPVSILKNPIVQLKPIDDAHNTAKTTEEPVSTEAAEPAAPTKRHVQHHQPQRQQQSQHHHHNRYRGKNRR